MESMLSTEDADQLEFPAVCKKADQCECVCSVSTYLWFVSHTHTLVHTCTLTCMHLRMHGELGLSTAQYLNIN